VQHFDPSSGIDPADRAAIRAAMHSLQDRDGRPGRRRQFADLESWVAGFFTQTFARHQARWCRKWWDHPEAVYRLGVLWDGWEHAADDHRALAAWLRGSLNPALSVLFDADGPFSACGDDGHRRPPGLPSDEAPANWWPEGWWDMLGPDERSS
jgi:hypothetical protein